MEIKQGLPLYYQRNGILFDRIRFSMHLAAFTLLKQTLLLYFLTFILAKVFALVEMLQALCISDGELNATEHIFIFVLVSTIKTGLMSILTSIFLILHLYLNLSTSSALHGNKQ